MRGMPDHYAAFVLRAVPVHSKHLSLFNVTVF